MPSISGRIYEARFNWHPRNMFHTGYEGAFQNAEKVNGPSYMNCDAEDKSNKCMDWYRHWYLVLLLDLAGKAAEDSGGTTKPPLNDYFAKDCLAFEGEGIILHGSAEYSCKDRRFCRLSFFYPPSLIYNFFPFELVTYNKSMLLSFGISQRAMQVFGLPSAAENMCCCLMCLLSCRRPFTL